MDNIAISDPPINYIKVRHSSYLVFMGLLLAVWYFHFTTPLLTVLFSYLALSNLSFLKRKWLAVIVFVILVLAIFYGFFEFIKQAVDTIPKVIADSVPIVLQTAEKYEIELPFNNVGGVRTLATDWVTLRVGEVAGFAKIATKEFVLILISLVVSISIYFDKRYDLNTGNYKVKDNLYTVLVGEIVQRFSNLYQSFSTVMGAQIIISLINTLFTGLFVFIVGLPYFSLIVALTFLCGLLPIIGNIISNTIIFAVAVKVSVQDAIFALIFLIVLHKIEYFLNSKIVGGRIKNPMWLTLLSLIVGEQLMGIPGMILAPAVLHFLKIEGSQYAVQGVKG